MATHALTTSTEGGAGKPAQKAVQADSIFVGDQVFRTHTEHGDLMLIVKEIGQGIDAGREVFVWIGTLYKLEGEGTGPNASFLGDMTARPTGSGVWRFPVDLRVHKGVPKDEAD